MQTAVALEVQQLPWALVHSLMLCVQIMPGNRAEHAADAHCIQLGPSGPLRRLGNAVCRPSCVTRGL